MRGRRFHITFSPSDSAQIWMEHRTFFKCTGPWSCPTGKLLCSANVLLWPPPSPRIDESSPLWTMSPDSLKEKKFEIILTLEGIVPETGNNIQVHKCGFYYLLRKQIMFQVRTSYLPTEILWGYKFEHSCVEYNPKLATYEVSFESLNTMIRDNTPW